MVASIATALGDPAPAWFGVMALTFAIYVLGFWVVIRSVTSSTAAATVGATAFMIATVDLPPLYMGMPKYFTVSLALVAILLFVSVLLVPSPDRVVATTLLAIGASAAHLGAAQMIAVGWVTALVGVLAVQYARRQGGTSGAWTLMRRAALPVGATTLVVGPALLQRLAVLRGTSVGGGVVGQGLPSLEAGSRLSLWGLTIVNPLEFPGPLLGLGFLTALAVLAVRFPEFTLGRASTLLTFGLMPILVGFNPLLTPVLNHLSPYALDRVAWVTLLPIWVVVISGAVAYTSRSSHVLASQRQPHAIASWLCVACLLAATGSAMSRDVRRWHARDTSGVEHVRIHHLNRVWGPSVVSQLNDTFGSSWPVVIGSPHTQYDLAGIAPVLLVAPGESHTPFFMLLRDFRDRHSDSFRFMHPETTEHERREIISKYGVRYVVVDYVASRTSLGIENVALLAETAAILEEHPASYERVLRVPGALDLFEVKDRQ